jgi:Homeodomain-like domain
MPWNECEPMDERLRFVARLLEGEKMAPVCREFGISRLTGCRTFERYKECGLDGLHDRRRAPYRQANKLPFQVERAILGIKKEYPSWGAPKIRDKAIWRSLSSASAFSRSTSRVLRTDNLSDATVDLPGTRPEAVTVTVCPVAPQPVRPSVERWPGIPWNPGSASRGTGARHGVESAAAHGRQEEPRAITVHERKHRCQGAPRPRETPLQLHAGRQPTASGSCEKGWATQPRRP